VDADRDPDHHDPRGDRGWGIALPISLLWNGTDEALRQIWLTIRLPRVLLALAIGGSLALAGCVMQGLFRNPLADPGLLGISSGAALAVALWVVLPLSLPALVMLYAPMLAAFLGALAATFVIFLLSRQRDASLSRLLLVGIAINALCGAAVGVLSWLSNDAQLRQLSLWGMGSLGQAQWSTLLAVASLMVPTVLRSGVWQAPSTCCSWVTKRRTTSAWRLPPCSGSCCCAAPCWWPPPLRSAA
jgi:iron complex transport system permease protein